MQYISRDRNREHAKKARLRKAELLGTLRDEMEVLRRSNLALRRIISARLPQLSHKIFKQSGSQSITAVRYGTEEIFMSVSRSAPIFSGRWAPMSASKLELVPLVSLQPNKR